MDLNKSRPIKVSYRIALAAFCLELASQAFSGTAEARYLSVEDLPKPDATIMANDLSPPSPAVVLGQGYNIISDKLGTDCLAANGHDHSEGVKGAARTDIEYINTVSDLQSYESSAQQSASLSVTYKLFTGGLNDDRYTDKSFNSVNQYARIFRKIVVKIETRNDGDWTKKIGDIVDKGLSNPNNFTKFTEKCGTHFISAIYRGDIIDQTIHFELNKTSYTAEKKTQFSAGIKGIFSAGYSDANALKQVTENSSYVGKLNNAGLIGKSAPDPNKTGGILDAAKFAHTTYADQVAEAEIDKSGIIGVEIQPYWRSNARGTDPLARWQDDAFDHYIAARAKYLRLLSVIGDLSFASSLPAGKSPPVREVFYDDSDASLQAKIALAITLQTNFKTSAENCYTSAITNDEQGAKRNCGTALDDALKTADIEKARPIVK